MGTARSVVRPEWAQKPWAKKWESSSAPGKGNRSTLPHCRQRTLLQRHCTARSRTGSVSRTETSHFHMVEEQRRKTIIGSHCLWFYFLPSLCFLMRVSSLESLWTQCSLEELSFHGYPFVLIANFTANWNKTELVDWMATPGICFCNYQHSS